MDDLVYRRFAELFCIQRLPGLPDSVNIDIPLGQKRLPRREGHSGGEDRLECGFHRGVDGRID